MLVSMNKSTDRRTRRTSKRLLEYYEGADGELTLYGVGFSSGSVGLANSKAAEREAYHE
jgi:hypothetical protein